ncbi:MAG: F0F1 ATP synthase subunit gamma [Actinomycetota bacterium]|nr:F0F1 ATP synthase subunit gamma [Actinomycetota bacterium]
MKITRAMELIAASRILRAQQRVEAAQPYVEKLREVISNVAAATAGPSHLLLERREVRRAGLVVISSDRGLAGAYNTNVLRLAEVALQEHRTQGQEYRLYAVGKKAQGYFRYRGYQIERSFLGVTDTPGYGDARAIAATVLNDFAEGAVDTVEICFTRFLSALTQTPVRWELLPITPPEDLQEGDRPPVAYAYEPSPEQILERLLPRYVEATIFGVLLEASASEHASRRRAMKAATENAEDLTTVLRRQANQARQAEITTEISEIVGGAEALVRG